MAQIPSKTNAWLRKIAKRHLPPSLVALLRRTYHRFVNGDVEWEYLPTHSLRDAKTRGWNVEAVALTQISKWQAFLHATEGANALGISHEGSSYGGVDNHAQHTITTFAFVLALAARNRTHLSMLDWGCGIGHYFILSRRILPDLDLEYYGKDVPILCAAGRQVLPNVNFIERDEDVSARRFDLIVTSGSLQYSDDWKAATRMLASCANDYIFVSRMPVVTYANTFVVLQRAYSYGYGTEYAGWFFNREEYLAHMTSLELELVREFVLGEHAIVCRAPEQAMELAFLFKKK